MQRALLIGLSLSCLLRAEDPAPQKVRVTNTDKVDFPAGGTLHLKNALGNLSIEGWDQPNLEITTTKTSTAQESVKVSTERKGDEVVISTEFPTHRKMARPFLGLTDVDLEYHIRVPRSARLVVEQENGDMYVDGISGEIHAAVHTGQITLSLPDGQYAIDAKSTFGAVYSDFSGTDLRSKWHVVGWPGHTFTATSASPAQKLSLHVGSGDIVILKTYK